MVYHLWRGHLQPLRQERQEYPLCVETERSESIPKQYGDGFPKDRYGLSFIAVYVDAVGEIINVTSRWNTIQEDDHFLTVDELKQLLGNDFGKLQ